MPDDVGAEAKGWTVGKKLTALLATAGAVVGLATGTLTLRDQLFPEEKGAGKGDGEVSVATASQLSDDVQFSRFEELLGPPLRRERLRAGEYVKSEWESTDVAVVAYSDRQAQVVAYTLTALAPQFNPLVEQVRGGVRLRSSVFADIDDEPQGVSGVYPPNGQWSYTELYGGGYPTRYKQVVLAASWTANANDAAATELTNVADCLPFSVFEARAGCDRNRVEALRKGLHITSMTIGEPAALEAVGRAGALFFAEAGTGK